MEDKSRHIRQMFDRIAMRYDLLNHLLSAGSDFYWRKAALDKLNASTGSCVLDVGTGTGDLALGVLRRAKKPDRVIGVDLALKMMQIGREKARLQNDQPVCFIGGNAESLPLKTERFDGIMVAFGVRNFADITAGLHSMYRVLKPGGRLVVLELSRPLFWGLRHGYQVYFKYLLPRIGGLISGDAGAYQYLHKSVMDFPERDRFETLMIRQGFVQTGYRDLSLGIATIYWGDKAQ